MTNMNVAPDELVSVIIPCWNAAETLDRTLISARTQTHRSLEIIVVDDGSDDRSTEIVLDHYMVDPRIKLLRQTNRGVAHARNRGIAEARGRLIAFLDADDLWTERKIERQLDAFRTGPTNLGLVYSLYARIDDEDRIIWNGPTDGPEGDAIRAICERNFVGNASSPLIKHDALRQAGGFDTSLQAQGAQGCEDHLLYFRIALAWSFAIVRRADIGYRLADGAMSANHLRMLRSHDLCVTAFLKEARGKKGAIRKGRRIFARHIMKSALTSGNWPAAKAVAARIICNDPSGLLIVLLSWLRQANRGRRRPTESHRLFSAPELS